MRVLSKQEIEGEDAYLRGDALMLHYYPHLGIINEDNYGIWKAPCGCSGCIDEDYDAVVDYPCPKHFRLKRVKQNSRLQDQKLGKETTFIFIKGGLVGKSSRSSSGRADS